MSKPYHLVGHRGFPQAYPENTLTGILAAIVEGADAIEFDIQASKDGLPVVIHDDNLARTTGLNAPLADYTLSLLEKISAHEPDRFGAAHLPDPIASLETLCQALLRWPAVEVFAEIKAEVFSRFTRAEFMARVAPLLRPLGPRCHVISFDAEILSIAKDQGFSIGWVLPTYDAAAHLIAQRLQPEFLICDKHALPAAALWAGDWQWFVYDVVAAGEAQALLARGVTYIETWDIAGLKCGLEDS